jgi:hypothetical protein
MSADVLQGLPGMFAHAVDVSGKIRLPATGYVD